MKRFLVLPAVLFLAAHGSAGATPLTHQQLQAVHPDGTSSFDDHGPAQVTIEGILLNCPEEWLDPAAAYTPDFVPWFMGGEWEVFIQGEGDDHAGTAVWIGQNYGNGPGYDNYTDAEWLAHLHRINRDPATGYVFHPGDRVRVTGSYLFYKGKLNINENHSTDPALDFHIELIEPAVGLPQPEPVTLADLKDPDDRAIFDPNRMTGCEYHQCRLIRIQDVQIVDPENWGPDSTITIADGAGRTLPVYLALGSGFDRYPCPTGTVDVVGILDQFAPGMPPQIDATAGYRLLALNYDGNGLVLTDRGKPRGDLPGDVSRDYIVDLGDFAEIALQWMRTRDGLYVEPK